MAFRHQPVDALAHFLPEGAYPYIRQYLNQYPVTLTITKSRATKYGDYSFQHQRHKISINGNLNPYEFLITLLHELAHLITFLRHERNVAPHGIEWKNCYAGLLKEFMALKIFPDTLVTALEKHLTHMKATHCNDPALTKALQAYNAHPNNCSYVSDFPVGAIFHTKQGEPFQILAKLRTRYRCQSLVTKYIYLFPGMYEVQQSKS